LAGILYAMWRDGKDYRAPPRMTKAFLHQFPFLLTHDVAGVPRRAATGLLRILP